MNVQRWLRLFRRIITYILPIRTLETNPESPVTLSDRSKQHFDEVLHLYSGGDRESALEHLSAMGKLKRLPDEFLLTLMEAAARNSTGENREHHWGLRSQAEKLAPTLLPASNWLLLYQVCFRCGLLESAGILRDHALDTALESSRSGDATPEEVERSFRALVERGQFGRAREELNRLEDLVLLPPNLRAEYRIYLHLNAGDLQRAVSLAETLPDYRPDFRRYLEGRSVAVAGPASSEEKLGELIDSFDLVARMNYGKGSGGGDPDVYGSRTDLAYYNREFLEYLKEEDAWEFLDRIDYAIFKCQSDVVPDHLLSHGKVRRHTARLFYFSGFPNLGQLSLVDLLLYRPSRLKIFHMNFYHDRTAHHEGYFTDHDHAHENHLRSLAVHDCLSQIRITRNLRDAGLVEVDATCGQVLDMDEEQYLSDLEKIYVGRRR